MTRRRAAQHHRQFVAWIPVLCSVAFLAASNYCNLEAFATLPGQAHDAHESAVAAHHADESSPPAHHHDEGALACCAAMQAVTTPKIDFHVASASTWQVHPVAPDALPLALLLAPSRAASGLSPPPREPAPDRPFYRAIYANHAPPVFLA